ncbi:MAG: class I SAM-dependent methyltransferase [Isosphaerales bacterium]
MLTKPPQLAWDTFSAGYTEKVFTPLQFPDVVRRIVAEVRPGRVLDMGCGPTPYLLRKLAALSGVTLYASDYSQKMLDAARRHFREGEVTFVLADHLNLPFDDAFFDTVISVNSILPETRDLVGPMFAQALRVLKPGGRLVALLPAFETSLMARDDWKMEIQIDEAGHREFDTTGWQCFYTAEDVAKLIKAHELLRSRPDRVYFKSDDAIAAIRKIYGGSLSAQVLHKYPLFEHLLVAEKAGQPVLSAGAEAVRIGSSSW